MQSLDEKKLDELAKADFKITGWVPTEWAVMNFKRGYRQAFADQGDKIKRLEKAVELMRSGFKYFMEPFDCEIEMLPDFHYRRAELTLAEVDSILKGAE